ncbi:PREDICTED: uncharacterized protein LOC105564012, partial [Vollenhovia emeryi]|uniref:uncharacterized protein LOC105564012 n=1 Tax=Vollenhovia emeryi TaxID=411798 RepID=UPI0005F4EBFF
TAWVTVSAPSGRAVEVRALLDQGSEVTFVTERLAQALYLKRLRMPTSISAVGGVKVGTCRHAAHVTISPRSASTPKLSTTALILNTLTAYSPKRLPAESVLDQLQDLSWADNDPMSSAPIDILLGADLYGDIILSGLRKTTVGRPIAQESIFGWVISGPVSCPELSSQTKSDEKSAGRICAQITSLHCSHDLSLDRELRQFWEVEEVPQHTAYGPEEERCEDHFRSTHSRLSDGRYVVRLPFRTSPPIAIGESYRIAETRLNALLRRLRTNADHEKEYSEFLQEYENLGHMQKVTNPRSPDTQCVFIPHHHVIRDHSSTTHLRVVFNASSATTNGSSLNDHLLAGPKLQTDLPAIIL